jgi:predicted signal transduction protein with EAL and GGDEF domain
VRAEHVSLIGFRALDHGERRALGDLGLALPAAAARALGMTTTAEGVETDGQKQFLAALGCDEAQGYLFSEPVPVEKIPDIIASWSAQRTLAA